MKKVLSSLLVAGIAASLIGCASNTQGENTAIGAVTGGVVGGLAGSAITGGSGVGIGVGVLAGALIGGAIGNNMESSDHPHVYTAVESGHSVTWVNKHTHTRYTVTPVGKPFSMNDYHYCRKFATTAVMSNGHVEKSTNVACRTSKGWKAM